MKAVLVGSYTVTGYSSKVWLDPEFLPMQIALCCMTDRRLQVGTIASSPRLLLSLSLCTATWRMGAGGQYCNGGEMEEWILTGTGFTFLNAMMNIIAVTLVQGLLQPKNK